ncbi:MAG: hypothetical protein ACLVBK_01185 [Oscillospiraceae bacterium]
MRALCYAQTNIGSGRDNNEDNYYCNGTFKRDPAIPVAEAAAEQESRRLIYGVFDGMGGEANGEQAALLCGRRCTSAAATSRLTRSISSAGQMSPCAT